MGYVIAGLVALAAIFGALWQVERAAFANYRTEVARDAAETKDKVIAAHARADQADERALRVERDAAVARERTRSRLNQEIANAEDGPVARALRAAVDGVRGRSGKDRAGTAPDT